MSIRIGNFVRILYSVALDGRSETWSGSGFRKEENADGIFTGRATRGAIFLRVGSSDGQPASIADKNPLDVHFLDWHRGTLKQVTRSTFTSEGLAAVLATDQSLSIALSLHEIENGPHRNGPNKSTS